MFPQRRTRIRKARFGSFSHVLIVVCAALLSVLGALGLSVSVAESAGADNWSPVHSGDFPDPTVVCVPTACGAGAASLRVFNAELGSLQTGPINIQESTSTNGVNWTPSNVRDALPQVGAWAQAGATWAPSVAFNGSPYVMYYTATEIRQPNDQCIGVAISPTPSSSTPIPMPTRSSARTGTGGRGQPSTRGEVRTAAGA